MDTSISGNVKERTGGREDLSVSATFGEAAVVVDEDDVFGSAESDDEEEGFCIGVDMRGRVY